MTKAEIKIEMKGYASRENAVRAAEKYLAQVPAEILSAIRFWTVIALEGGRFAPAVHVGQAPGGPGPWLNSPFFIFN